MDKNKFFIKCVLITITAALCVSVSSCKKEEKKSALEEASTSDAQTKVLEEAKSQSKLSGNNVGNSESTDNSSEGVIGGSDNPTDIYVTDKGEEQLAYSPGTLTDTTYKSKYIGVSFSLPEGYEMEYTSEQIAQQNASLAEADNEGQRYMKYEVGIINRSENIQVIVNVDGEKEEYDETTYLGYVAANYEQALKAEIDRTAFYATIAGKQYTAMKIKTTMGEILYCVRKNGSDIISFIISYPEGADDKIETVMNAFTPY